MARTRTDLRAAAKQLAQDASTTGPTGLKLLLTDPGDYNLAISQALPILGKDRPNIRVVDYTVLAAGFRFVLAGAGAILPAGLDAWVDGASQLVAVWHPYLVTSQGDEPLDPNTWRIVTDPGPKTVLELLAQRAAIGDVVRFEYSSPWVLHEDNEASSSVRAGDWEALSVLSASLVLQVAANKLAQNTGNTGLPSDVVERRSQADVFRSLAKDLRTLYSSLVGHGPAGDLGAASGVRDLDVLPSHNRGFLWHPLNTH